jgi:hypothetical protein
VLGCGDTSMIHRIPLSLKGLKASALAVIDEAEAITILLNQLTPGHTVAFRELREMTRQTPSMRRLRELNLIRNSETRTQELRKDYGIRASREQLLEFLREARSIREDEVIFVHRVLLSAMVSAYDDDEWPAHSQVMIDPHGKQARWPQIEVRLLEVTLYEDMCILFNQADSANRDKVAWKTALAMCRATVTSAYYFVECYLNGVAARHLAAHGTAVDQTTHDLLTEWDSQKKRDKRLPMRDKILKYTKIASGQAHPPLQESNCPEMEVLTRIAKQPATASFTLRQFLTG